jgi:hypothetical protein
MRPERPLLSAQAEGLGKITYFASALQGPFVFDVIQNERAFEARISPSLVTQAFGVD